VLLFIVSKYKKIVSKIPTVAIIGRPNVGKSTLFNRLIGKRQAIIAKEAGTTRDTVSGEVVWDNKPFVLFDTAGVITDFYGFKEQEIEEKAQEKISDALELADVILFVMDAKRGVTAEDKVIANKIRKYSSKIIPVLNKSDSEREEKLIVELNELGFKEGIAVSSITGRRTGNLLDRITQNFKKTGIVRDEIKKIAIVGRPNVGKSTLFNLITESNLAIVSRIAGTTRDAVRLKIKLPSRDRTVEVIDTAGFRKRGKIQVGIEKFSVLRAIESIYSSDVVLLVVDGKEGFTRIDAHLAQLALSNDKKLLVVINKIDLLKNRLITEVPEFSRFKFILKNQIIGISAKTQENLPVLIKLIIELT